MRNKKKALKKFLVGGWVVQSDYSVSSLSLLEIKKEKERRERQSLTIYVNINSIMMCKNFNGGKMKE